MSSFVISRTPYRVSFFGGGTDYPAWYRENPGAVLATSINKYCCLLCRWLPPFFEEKNRVVWSQIELTQDVDEIRHPSVREALKFMGINGVELHHFGDLPARAGMGTSSAFTVAILHALDALKRMKPKKMTLALNAIHVEQDLIKENVGSQDQATCAFGGFNRIEFSGDHNIRVQPVKAGRLKELETSLMLFFTGFSRTASKIAGEQIERIKENKPVLKRLYEMVDEGLGMLLTKNSLTDFGKLLSESWRLKKRLSDRVSTDYIDYIEATAISAGAVGGKLLGAGGGGFMLFFVEPDLQPRVKGKLSSLLHVPFEFEKAGSQIIFNEGGYRFGDRGT